MRRSQRFLLSTLLLGTLVAGSRAEEIGSVDTVFKFLGPNHKIVVDAFDDPKVTGVTCYLSRSDTATLVENFR